MKNKMYKKNFVLKNVKIFFCHKISYSNFLSSVLKQRLCPKVGHADEQRHLKFFNFKKKKIDFEENP